MFVHVDGLLRFVGFDELLLSFFESILILEMKCILEMDFGEFILRVIVCKSESFIKPFLVGLEVNCSFNETILDQELSSLFTLHILSNLDGDLSKFLLIAVGFCNS